MADKRTYQLNAQSTPSEDLKIGADDSSFTEEKNLTLAQVNEKTRSSSGLKADGSYDKASGSNYIDAAASLHAATLLLDAAAKSAKDDAGTNATAIATLTTELDARIKRVAVTVNRNDLLGNLRNGIVLVPALANHVIEILSVTIKNNFISTPYNAGDPLHIRNGGSPNPLLNIPDVFIQASYAFITRAEFQNEVELFSADDIILISTADLTGGDSDFIFYISYRYISV